MKATLAIITLLLTATSAMDATAGDRGKRDKHYNVVVDDQRYYNKKYNKKRYKQDIYNRHVDRGYSQQRIRLDIPVRVRGDGRLPLKRLLNQHYDIDLQDYRLVKVVVNNKNRYAAGAGLRVGNYRTGYVPLDRGRNHIRAPRQANWGRWVLNLDNVKTNNVRVVLAPRYQHAYKRRVQRDDWWAHLAVKW